MSDIVEGILVEAVKELRKKYRYMDEVGRLTKELADALSRDDKVAAQMLLEMRGKELEGIGECDRHMDLLLSGMPDADREKVKAILNGGFKEGDTLDTGLWKEMKDTMHQTVAVWKQTVEIDKVISRRLAGSDSYYKLS